MSRPLKKPPTPASSITEFFGAALKRHRIDQNMTQAALAYGAGISQTKIPAIEAGRINIHLRTAEALARSVGAHLKDLLPD